MRVIILGGPHRVGGAGGECLGAIQLWRKFGLDVTVVPTWEMPAPQYAKQVTDLGCELKLVHPRSLGDVEGIRGGTVVCFCNEAAMRAKHALASLGCRVIFAPLMCFLQRMIYTAAQQGWIHDWVFQSEYQESILAPQLRAMGYKDDKFHRVRGYIDWPSIKFKPLLHVPGEPFWMGRAARPRASKWHRDWWKMYEVVPERQAILLGIDEETIRQIGRPPGWAEVHPPGTYPIEAFYRRLHATVTFNESDHENWPRVTLESMAHGVAVVSENAFGYREQIEHDVTGCMANTTDGVGYLAKQLSLKEDWRMSLIQNARKRLEDHLSNPELIWEQWRKVFGIPSSHTCAPTRSISSDDTVPVRGMRTDDD